MRRSFSQKRALSTQLFSPQLPPLPLPRPGPADPVRLHEQALLCARLSRVLHSALLGLDWPQVRFSDRNRLKRSLTLLAGDIPLVWLIAGQPLEEAPPQSTQQQAILNHGKEEQQEKFARNAECRARREPVPLGDQVAGGNAAAR